MFTSSLGLAPSLQWAAVKNAAGAIAVIVQRALGCPSVSRNVTWCEAFFSRGATVGVCPENGPRTKRRAEQRSLARNLRIRVPAGQILEWYAPRTPAPLAEVFFPRP